MYHYTCTGTHTLHTCMQHQCKLHSNSKPFFHKYCRLEIFKKLFGAYNSIGLYTCIYTFASYHIPCYTVILEIFGVKVHILWYTYMQRCKINIKHSKNLLEQILNNILSTCTKVSYVEIFV